MDKDIKDGIENIRNAIEGLVDILYKKEIQPKELPKPTHYCTREGGKWYNWIDLNNRGMQFTRNGTHAIKFDNGAIFDMVNGWRQSSWGNTVTWTCPYCDAIYRAYDGYKNHVINCNGKAQSIESVPERNEMGAENHLQPSDFSERLVRRYPVEISPEGDLKTSSTDQRIVSRGLLENAIALMEAYCPESSKACIDAVNDLTKALQTEKSELRAPK